MAGEGSGSAHGGRELPGAASPRPSFSPSQTEILRLLVEGLSNGEIAARVHLSENTVKTHVREILRRSGTRNRVEAAVQAVRMGWV